MTALGGVALGQRGGLDKGEDMEQQDDAFEAKMLKLLRDSEQMEAGAEALAKMAAAHFHALVFNGLTRAEALHLTSVMMAATLGKDNRK